MQKIGKYLLISLVYNYLLLGMETIELLLKVPTTRMPTTYFELLVDDVQKILRKYIIRSHSHLFKTVLPPLSYTLLRNHNVQEVCITHDGRWALTLSDYAYIFLWDLKAAPTFNPRSLVPLNPSNRITTIRITPDGKWAITGSENTGAILWDLEDKPTFNPRPLVHENAGPITALCITPDGRWALIGSQNATIILWDLHDPNNLDSHQLPGEHSQCITSVCLSENSNYAIIGSDDLVTFWSLSDPYHPTPQRLEFNVSPPASIALSSNGLRALTGSTYDCTARLWNFDEEKPRPTPLTANTKYPSPMTLLTVLTPDSRWAIAATEDATVAVWDLSNMALKVYKGHDRHISSMCITPDGRWVLTGSNDRTAILYNLQESYQYELKGHKSKILSVALCSKGRWGITSSIAHNNTPTLLLWDLSPIERTYRNMSLGQIIHWIQTLREKHPKLASTARLASASTTHLGESKAPKYSSSISYTAAAANPDSNQPIPISAATSSANPSSNYPTSAYPANPHDNQPTMISAATNYYFNTETFDPNNDYSTVILNDDFYSIENIANRNNNFVTDLTSAADATNPDFESASTTSAANYGHPSINLDSDYNDDEDDYDNNNETGKIL